MLNWASCEHQQEAFLCHKLNVPIHEELQSKPELKTPLPSEMGQAHQGQGSGSKVVLPQCSWNLSLLPNTSFTFHSIILDQDKTQGHWTQPIAFNTSADFLRWITYF